MSGTCELDMGVLDSQTADKKPSVVIQSTLLIHGCSNGYVYRYIATHLFSCPHLAAYPMEVKVGEGRVRERARYIQGVHTHVYT